MKILIVNDQFERGGAARVAATQINGLLNRGHQITVITDNINYKLNYKLPSQIKLLQINLKLRSNKVLRWLSCAKTIRKYIKHEDPDVIIAIQSLIFFVVWIANLGLGKKIIAADHTSFNIKTHPLLNFIRYHFYTYADALSILTKKDEKILGKKFPKKKVIYNPLPFPIITKEVKREKNILCAGRLESWYIKGFDIILDIWQAIESLYPEWNLEIAGSGDTSAQKTIHEMISKRHLDQRVKLLYNVNDMRSLYQQSSIFVLSSRTEGFPMVLMEAMSQGCACIAFSVYGATNEMMSKKSGIIIEDGNISGFTDALKMLIQDSNLRAQYAKNAINEIAQFSEERFISSWENLLNSVVNPGQKH